ncbi:ROK family glucokinase [Candidatus Galacturonibacter soehngenii]|uniref:Glucokinase n=1 Tax=Candidatus Galacturonatibacter soehngenii TaxID=2307010 RepID=A0A7V7UBP9_9FIRM|nr:ROK family glucokinase [Candidatus Galacturonibacter soehngenii]KAB1438303.1 ROK family glucokinase [Candidatus Galacturonibacter soehngenii]MBA4686477.1 ROK family glucokinase [Candidatus Galacturonibacter soehngenii]
MSKVCFGVDVGGTTVKLGLFQADGQVMDKWEIVTRTQEKGKHILPDIAASIQAKISEKAIEIQDVAGVGIGVPGPVKEDGTVLNAVNLGWGIFNVANELEKLTHLKVKAGNDANVAALGEMWQGGGRGSKNVVMITLGTGVGGGIIHNGEIITGTNGAGGEVGHIHVEDSETDTCGCGKKGCLEQMASATGVVRLAKKALELSDSPSLLRNGEISAKAVFDAVKENDALAISVAEQFGKYLGTALANVAAVTDPEVFVIGGGVSKAGSILIDYIKKYYVLRAFAACKETKFSLAELGNDAGIFGAAKLVL